MPPKIATKSIVSQRADYNDPRSKEMLERVGLIICRSAANEAQLGGIYSAIGKANLRVEAAYLSLVSFEAKCDQLMGLIKSSKQFGVNPSTAPKFLEDTYDLVEKYKKLMKYRNIIAHSDLIQEVQTMNDGARREFLYVSAPGSHGRGHKHWLTPKYKITCSDLDQILDLLFEWENLFGFVKAHLTFVKLDGENWGWDKRPNVPQMTQLSSV